MLSAICCSSLSAVSSVFSLFTLLSESEGIRRREDRDGVAWQGRIHELHAAEDGDTCPGSTGRAREKPHALVSGKYTFDCSEKPQLASGVSGKLVFEVTHGPDDKQVKEAL